MATKEVVRVVEGEASESDSEEEINIGYHQSVGLVVEGEAPETDSEDETNITPGSGLPPLKVKHGSPGDSVSFGSSTSESEINSDETRLKRKEIPKYDTLLHRKLRDRNAALRSHLESSACHTYLSCAKDINNTTQQLAKSQLYIQDVSHNLRVLSSDLKTLETRVDLVISCNILPTFQVPESVMQNHRRQHVQERPNDEAATKTINQQLEPRI